MPHATLFDADVAGERAASFRRDFLRQVASLAIPDLNRYSMSLDREYSVSDVDALVPAFNYRLPFARSQRTAVGQLFRRQIAEELRKTGSTLSPEDIIDRAETQNCAGCHGKPGAVGDGQFFPKASERGEHLADETLGESAVVTGSAGSFRAVPHRRTEAISGGQRMRKLVAVLVVMVSLTVQADVDVKRDDRTRQFNQRADADLIQLYLSLSDLSLADQRQQMWALSSRIKAALWRYNIERYLRDHPELSVAAQEILQDGVRLVTRPVVRPGTSLRGIRSRDVLGKMQASDLRG